MIKPFAAFIACLVAGYFAATPARAQATKIFIASTGSDFNDGSRAAPKRGLQAAHDAVAPGGEIVILDTAGYGPLTISKSVAITVPPGVNGFVTVPSGSNGIMIFAGVNDKISIRGLILEGGGAANNDGVGIMVSKGALDGSWEDCTIPGVLGLGRRLGPVRQRKLACC